MAILALIRHGQSRWNLKNKFSGWVDVPLSPHGIRESQETAKELKKYSFDVAYTSDLSRAQQTLLIILSEQNRTGIFTHNGISKHSWFIDSNNSNNDELPIIDSTTLNERYYGELQGMDKNDARRIYGEDKVLAWRRGYKDRPPRGESLEDVYKRVAPYYEKKILKNLDKNRNVIVVIHGNSLRAIVKHIKNIHDENMPLLEFPTGRPILFEYNPKAEGDKYKELNDGINFERKIYWEKPQKAVVS